MKMLASQCTQHHHVLSGAHNTLTYFNSITVDMIRNHLRLTKRIFPISNIRNEPSSLNSHRSYSYTSSPTSTSIFSEEFYKIKNDMKIVSHVSEQIKSKGYASESTLDIDQVSDEGKINVGNTIPILSIATCETLKQETIPNLFQGNFDTGIFPDEWHWRQGISRDDAAREMCNSWKASRVIASIVLNKDLGEFIAKVMGWQSVRIAQDDIVWKTPTGNRDCNIAHEHINTVGFHQDSAYISTQFEPYENNSVTLWIALDDANKENGSLEYAVGSHRWPISHLDSVNDNLGSSSFHYSDQFSYRNSSLHDAYERHVRNCENNARDLKIETVNVNTSYGILHHQDAWHGSGPNVSFDRHRRALVAHYLDGKVQFASDDRNRNRNPPFGKTSYIYGRYKRYNSTEVDETFFPIIYTAPDAGHRRTEWIDEYIKSSSN